MIGANPVGRTVSQITARFTLVNDPKNKAAAKQAQQLQNKLYNSEKKLYDLQKKALNQDKLTRTEKSKLNEKLKKQQTLVEKNRLALKSYNAEQKLLNNNLNESAMLFSKAEVATYGWIAALAGLTATVTKGLKLNIQYIENLNVINQLFGDNTQAVLDWAASTRNSFGLARVSALQYIGTVKSFLTASGFGDKWGESKSTAVAGIAVQLAADLASFRNTSFDTAFRAILSGLAGISRTLRYNFGVDIGDEALKERFGTTGNTQAEKIMLRFIKLLESAGFVAGDFQRTKNSPANQIKLFKENFKEFSMLFAETLLPLVNMGLILLNNIMTLLIKLNGIMTWIGGLIATAWLVKQASDMMKFTPNDWSNLGMVDAAKFAFAAAFIAKMIGSLFGGFSEKTISKPQNEDNYLNDFLSNIPSGLASGQNIVINVAGDAKEDAIVKGIMEVKKEQFRRG